jgi:hypothetical protein
MLVWRERLTHHGRAGGHSLPPLQVRTAGRCPTIRESCDPCLAIPSPEPHAHSDAVSKTEK